MRKKKKKLRKEKFHNHLMMDIKGNFKFNSWTLLRFFFIDTFNEHYQDKSIFVLVKCHRDVLKEAFYSLFFLSKVKH
jgi:hypothetical protein